MTTAPVRIQLSRRKGWRMPPNTIKVDRSTRWGNVVAVGAEANVEAVDGNRYTVIVDAAIAVAIHRQIVADAIRRNPFHLEELRGKNLACWCALDAPCHVDVLLELANAPA